MKPKIGMAFGVFDGLHEGHKHFLNSAVQVCEELIVVVAPSDASYILKGKPTKHTLEERMHMIANWNPAVKVIMGDTELGSWNVFSKEKPDIVLLGYDQAALGEAMKKMGMPHTFLPAHEPEKYKTSLQNGTAV